MTADNFYLTGCLGNNDTWCLWTLSLWQQEEAIPLRCPTSAALLSMTTQWLIKLNWNLNSCKLLILYGYRIIYVIWEIRWSDFLTLPEHKKHNCVNICESTNSQYGCNIDIKIFGQRCCDIWFCQSACYIYSVILRRFQSIKILFVYSDLIFEMWTILHQCRDKSIVRSLLPTQNYIIVYNRVFWPQLENKATKWSCIVVLLKWNSRQNAT